MKSLNYYERLGVSRYATAKEIKSQYRKLAQVFHPDKTNGNKIAEESFKLINEAYACLSDENKRLEYDTNTFMNVEPGAGQVIPPAADAGGSISSFWQRAAAFTSIVLVLGALLSNQPKPKRRYKKRKKIVTKSRRQTPKRK